jgi:hypothetical protein
MNLVVVVVAGGLGFTIIVVARRQSADLSLAGSDVTFRSPIPSHHWTLKERKSMKPTFAIIVAALAAAALFGGLVHAVLWSRTSPSQPPPRFMA